MGMWARFGAKASVDWCEPNYVVSLWVAEWYNTLSSLLILVMGAYGLFRSQQQKVKPRFRFCFFVMALVGAGSAGFHATMLQSAQALDELPMIYGGLALLYCLVNSGQSVPQRERRWLAGLGIYAALFTACYFAMKSYFILFVVSYAAIITVVVIGAAKRAFSADGTTTHRRLFVVAAGSFCTGVFAFWFPEHVFLGCDHPLQAFHLHSWWHLFAAIGTYLGIRYAVFDHETRERDLAAAAAA